MLVLVGLLLAKCDLYGGVDTPCSRETVLCIAKYFPTSLSSTQCMTVTQPYSPANLNSQKEPLPIAQCPLGDKMSALVSLHRLSRNLKPVYLPA